jgi:tRNA(Ile)-lysidine synthase
MKARVNRWTRVADRLAQAIPLPELDHEVVRLASTAGRRRWVVAVSGGADSVALLLLLWAYWPERREQLVVAHFNHNLRGAASRQDARFCATLSKALGVTFVTDRWKNSPSDPSEAQARAARFAFVEKIRRHYRAYWVWTGHQADDVAETLLMRLARGSATAGLAAPRPIQVGERPNLLKLRPLLPLGAARIRDALAAAGGRWRDDASNGSARYLRNRIRHNVIPVWKETVNRDAVAGALLSRRLLEEDDAALHQWLAEIAPIDDQGRLSLKALHGKPIAIWRRALHAWLCLQPDQGDLSRRGFGDLLDLARAGRTSRFSLGKKGFVRIRRGWLFFEQPFVD